MVVQLTGDAMAFLLLGRYELAQELLLGLGAAMLGALVLQTELLGAIEHKSQAFTSPVEPRPAGKRGGSALASGSRRNEAPRGRLRNTPNPDCAPGVGKASLSKYPS